MNRPVRPALSALGIVFPLYLAVGATVWTRPVDSPWGLIASLVIYLSATVLCVFWPSRAPGAASAPGAGAAAITGGLGRPAAVPVWVALVGLAVALIVPNLTWLAAGEEARRAPFATWSLGAVGVLMTILVVRRRYIIAWSGMVALAASSVLWIGVADTLSLGIVGSVIWVGGAHLIMLLTDRAARETAELTRLQREASEWLATQEGRRRERRTRVQRALAVAGPVLVRTVAAEGHLDDDERLQARLAEGRLRDELRGPRLLDDAVRGVLEDLRRRGASVTFLDEGGLDGLDEAALTRIRRELADVLRDAASQRVYIRTSPHENVAVTVVGRTRGEDDRDEVVDLWREIANPTV